jgi:hypothetical protein
VNVSTWWSCDRRPSRSGRCKSLKLFS